MGYAMFAQRKILLTDSIFKLNQQLTDITNKRDDLFDIGTAISDGEVTSADIAACQEAGLTCAYGFDLATAGAQNVTDPEYQTGLASAEKEARQKYGKSWLANIGGAGAGAVVGAALGFGIPGAIIGGVLGGIVGNKCSSKTKARDEYVNQYKQEYANQRREEMVEALQKEIEKMENDLDKKKARVETQIQAQQTELQSVQQAEGNAIQQSTPKYAGVQ